jgi:uncharacterized protein (TIGR02001 family)
MPRPVHFLVALLLPLTGTAGELNGTATLTSEYVYRGLSLTDGNPALQAGLDYEFGSGLFLGAWASTLDLETANAQFDTELDLYLGYHAAPVPSLGVALTLMRRTFPGQSGIYGDDIDWDYTEALASATFYDRYTLEFGYADDQYGRGESAWHGELRADWTHRSSWVLGGGVGYYDLSELGTPGYWYWDLGATARYAWLTVDLRWYDNETPEGYYAALEAGSKLVLSLSTGF